MAPFVEDSTVLPLVPVRDLVLFPEHEAEIRVGRPATIDAISAALRNEQGELVVVVLQRDGAVDVPELVDLFDIGCVARVLRVEEADVGVSVRLRGLNRARIAASPASADVVGVMATLLPNRRDDEPALDAKTVETLRTTATALLIGTGWSDVDARREVRALPSELLADFVVGFLDLPLMEQQQLLEVRSTHHRAAVVLAHSDSLLHTSPPPRRGVLDRLLRRK